MKERKTISGVVKKRQVFFAAVFFIAVFAVFGDKGLMEVLRLTKERDGILSYNTALEAENLKLEKEIAALRTDRRYIEHIAKKELGMLGKNEVVYKFEGPE
ncbi:MAG TPA: septum formation initiator family protein [Thermodesulfobacteriota bacterium]|nr:septum formation initiator family protein [Thermodesulfobacteriota bacterium]